MVFVQKKNNEIERAREALAASKQVFIVTGAGISAESGIPTFRGLGGIWRTPQILLDIFRAKTIEQKLAIAWKWTLYFRRVSQAAQPNAAHVALAKWARERGHVTLLTQNIDGLHERAGHPDVIQFHGSLWKNQCLKCQSIRDDATLDYSITPVSPCCGVTERPAAVYFDEPIPEEAIIRAESAIEQADTFLVIGTSGRVAPSATYVQEACTSGKTVININPARKVPGTIHLRHSAVTALPQLLGISVSP